MEKVIKRSPLCPRPGSFLHVMHDFGKTKKRNKIKVRKLKPNRNASRGLSGHPQTHRCMQAFRNIAWILQPSWDSCTHMLGLQDAKKQTNKRKKNLDSLQVTTLCCVALSMFVRHVQKCYIVLLRLRSHILVSCQDAFWRSKGSRFLMSLSQCSPMSWIPSRSQVTHLESKSIFF